MENYGSIKIKVQEVMEQRELSRTRLAQMAFLQRKQLNKILDGSATRADFDVLARLCNALSCRIEDILEYVPDKGNK